MNNDWGVTEESSKGASGSQNYVNESSLPALITFWRRYFRNKRYIKLLRKELKGGSESGRYLGMGLKLDPKGHTRFELWAEGCGSWTKEFTDLLGGVSRAGRSKRKTVWLNERLYLEEEQQRNRRVDRCCGSKQSASIRCMRIKLYLLTKSGRFLSMIFISVGKTM